MLKITKFYKLSTIPYNSSKINNIINKTFDNYNVQTSVKNNGNNKGPLMFIIYMIIVSVSSYYIH